MPAVKGAWEWLVRWQAKDSRARARAPFRSLPLLAELRACRPWRGPTSPSNSAVYRGRATRSGGARLGLVGEPVR